MALDLRHWFLSQKKKNLSNVKFLWDAFVQKENISYHCTEVQVAALFTDFPGPKLASARINERKTSLQGGHICNECLKPHALLISVSYSVFVYFSIKFHAEKKSYGQIVKPRLS